MSSKRKRAGRPLGAEIQQEDAFLAGVLESAEWARKNREKLIFGLIALAVTVAGIVYYVSDRQQSANRAVAALERAQQTVQLGNVEAAKGELEGFLAQFGGTPYAAEARLILAGLHLDSGDAASAISAVEPVAGSGAGPIGMQAAALLAAAYEEAGRLDDAVRTYMDIANDAEMTFQSTDALLDAARLLTTQGDHDRARAAYRDALTELADTDPRRQMIEMRLAELGAGSTG